MSSKAKGKRSPPRGGGRRTPPPYEYFEERRKYPRVALGRAGILTFDSTERTCVVHDISPDGLQIRCDRETMLLLRPSGRAIKGNNGPLVTVALLLQVGREDQLLAANARLYYFVLLPGEEPMDVAFGARFVDLDAGPQALIERFMGEVLQPAETAPGRPE